MTTWRAAWLAMLLLGAAPARAVPVDLELVLAVDCSGSIDDDEFTLQIQGYAQALTHPSVISAIRSGTYRSIAVTYVQWSGPAIQNQAVGWTLIRDEATAGAFAAAMAGARRQIYGGGTSLSGAIDFSRPLFGRGFEGTRRAIDVSGDGTNNRGREPDGARDEALREGIIINGLAILTDFVYLDNYYGEHVIGGPGAFVIPAENFASFAAAILNKLIREIAELPAKPD
jgi:hypothetical protein